MFGHTKPNYHTIYFVCSKRWGYYSESDAAIAFIRKFVRCNGRIVVDDVEISLVYLPLVFLLVYCTYKI